jgi:hypothetical protein
MTFSRRTIGVLSAALANAVPLAGAGTTQAQTFSYTGGEQTYTVPAGVVAVAASLTGGTGGGGCPYGGGSGGAGATLAATIPVTPGQTLYVEVGADGTVGEGGWPTFGGGGAGGSRYVAGSGGGASDIRTESGALSSRLLVAAGGGGCGADNFSGANGGAGGLPGGNGGGGTGASANGVPGTGGTQSEGGSGGWGYTGENGQNGSLGRGGDGSSLYGGGGGGGYYGGGGGGETAGGGGGSSYAETTTIGVSGGTDLTATPQVTITPPPVVPSAAQVSFPATPMQSVSASRAITITNTSTKAATITGLEFDYSNGQNGDDYFVSADTCGGQLAAGANCTVRVKFNPQGAGASHSGLLITGADSSGNSLGTTEVALYGTGTGLPQGREGLRGATGESGATGGTGAQGLTGLEGPRGATRPGAAHRPDRPTKSSGARTASTIVISVCHTVHHRLVCRATVGGHPLQIKFVNSGHRVSLVSKGVRYALVTVTRTRHGSWLTIIRQFRKLVTGRYQAA